MSCLINIRNLSLGYLIPRLPEFWEGKLPVFLGMLFSKLVVLFFFLASPYQSMPQGFIPCPHFYWSLPYLISFIYRLSWMTFCCYLRCWSLWMPVSTPNVKVTSWGWGAYFSLMPSIPGILRCLIRIHII